MATATAAAAGVGELGPKLAKPGAREVYCLCMRNVGARARRPLMGMFAHGVSRQFRLTDRQSIRGQTV